MKTIRWGIIGVGNVTEAKSGPAFQKVEGSDLTAVMRRNGKAAADYARRHNVPKWYDDGDALINDPNVDAVYIATPPDSHLHYTLKVVEAGKPVYVEKPMARNFEECQRMIAASKQAGVPLFVAYYRRMLPRFLQVKRWIDEGAIGDVRLVSIRVHQDRQDYDPENLPWRVIPEVAGGGLFVDLASHILDYLDYVLGPVTAVEGFAVNQGSPHPAEDMVTGVFQFESGVQGVGSFCFTAHERQDLLEFTGTQGTIRMTVWDDAPILLLNRAGETSMPIANPENIQLPLIETIVAELNGSGTCPSTGETAARTNRVMDALLKGYYQT